MGIKISKFKHDDWIVYFSGDKWAPLGFSSWISLYTRRPFSPEVDYFVKQVVMVWDGEATTCYIRESERACFGKKVVKNAMKDLGYINYICRRFTTSTDQVLSVYRKEQKKFSFQEYDSYNSYFLNEYYPYHIQVKNVVDFLPAKLQKTNLAKLEKARIHAEPVFSQEIFFTKRIASYVSKKSGYQAKSILYCLVDELRTYWNRGQDLPDEKLLRERSQGCVIFFENGRIREVWSGAKISDFGSIFFYSKNKKLITGQTAFTGRVTGIVRIISDPAHVAKFNQGDILVAPWTRPEYLPIMKKAGAFVTDGGGILSHAAIVARELRKPCIIATKNATKLLKDGDLIEVDADRGIVSVLKRSKINN